MARRLYSNNAKSTLAANIGTGALSLTVQAGKGALFPTITGSDFFYVTLFKISGAVESSYEIVKVTARTGDVFTIVRAQEGTPATSYVSGDSVELRVTAENMTAAGLLYQSGGKLGVLQASPTYELDVSGTMRIQSVGTNEITGDTGNASLAIYNAGGGYALQLYDDLVLDTNYLKILGRFAQTNEAERTFFQTFGANKSTNVGAMPSGSSNTASFQVYNDSTILNTGRAFLSINASTATVTVDKIGAGTYLPLAIVVNGAQVAQFSTGYDVAIGSAVPAARLHVQAGRTILSSVSDALGLQLNYVDSSKNGPYLGSPGANVLQISNNGGTSLIKIDASGTGIRFIADLDNATVANRLFFQTTTTNAASSLGVLPNGSSVIARLNLHNNSDPTNSSRLNMATSATELQVRSDVSGTGTYLPLTFYTSGTERLKLETDGTFKSHLGIYTSRTSNGVSYGSNRYATWVDTNGNANQQGWAWVTHKTGTSDSLYLVALDDSGVITSQIFNIERKTADTVRYLNLNSPLLFRSSSGSPVNTSYHWLNNVEVSNLDAQQTVFAAGVAADVFGFTAVISQSTSTTTHTIDFSASNYYKLTMGHNIATLNLSSPGLPCVVQIEFVQDGAGNRTVAWPASLKWPSSYGAGDKALSTAISARDLLVLRWNGTDYIANLLKGIA
jgi:hypothetical protein